MCLEHFDQPCKAVLIGTLRGSRMVKPWCVSGGRTCSLAWSACRRSSGTRSQRAPAPRGTRCWRTSRATGRGRRCPHLWRHLDCLMTAWQPAWPATGSAAVQAGLLVLLLSPSCACHSAGCRWRIQLRLVHRCVQLDKELILGTLPHTFGVACRGSAGVHRCRVCSMRRAPDESGSAGACAHRRDPPAACRT